MLLSTLHPLLHLDFGFSSQDCSQSFLQPFGLKFLKKIHPVLLDKRPSIRWLVVWTPEHLHPTNHWPFKMRLKWREGHWKHSQDATKPSTSSGVWKANIPEFRGGNSRGTDKNKSLKPTRWSFGSWVDTISTVSQHAFFSKFKLVNTSQGVF